MTETNTDWKQHALEALDIIGKRNAEIDRLKKFEWWTLGLALFLIAEAIGAFAYAFVKAQAAASVTGY